MRDDVAAVLVEVIRHGSGESIDNAVDDLLAALTAAGYAVVKVPEGVAVEHGTKLIVHSSGFWIPRDATEATP